MAAKLGYPQRRILALFLLLTTRPKQTTVAEIYDDVGCGGKPCPLCEMPNSQTVDTSELSSSCKLWLGPSPIKEHEEHGFGLGMFTGVDIPKGTIFGHETMIPVFDYDGEDHPPLMEYLWNGDVIPYFVLESLGSTRFFIPGLGGIAPCTTNNFNLEQVHRVSEDSTGAHRARSPAAGAFSYHHNRMFTAVRDIVAGEELVVECADSDFDGGIYQLSRYDPKDKAVTCLDDAMTVGVSTIPNIGKGLFASRHVKKGEVLISTPVLSLMREELRIKATEPSRVDMELWQLLLNYCFSHPISDLLLLPYGPMFNYINHPPNDNTNANTFIKWHESPFDGNELPRRQQHYHPELFSMDPKQVAATHGKGLMIDLIASNDINEGDEIFLDYGLNWRMKWKRYVDQWQENQSAYRESFTEDAAFMSARDYTVLKHGPDIPFRTAGRQRFDPYPPNVQTACFFGIDWVDDEEVDEGITYASWNDHENHDCLLPCVIMEREEFTVSIDESHGENQSQGSTKKVLYTAKLSDVAHQLHENISYDCHLLPYYEYIYTDIPQEGIRFVNKPYSTDAFLEGAFREPMGVPEGFYPDAWLKKNVRRRKGESDLEGDLGEEFRRREVKDMKDNFKAKQSS